MRKLDVEFIVSSNDGFGAKLAISAIKKRFKDWRKIIDEYETLNTKQKKEFKKDPLNSAIIEEYEEINPLLNKLEEISQHDIRERRF